MSGILVSARKAVPAGDHAARLKADPFYAKAYHTAVASLAAQSAGRPQKPKPGYEAPAQPSRDGKDHGAPDAKRKHLLI